LLGGAGSLRDFSELIENVGVIGASAGSLFVFKGKYRAVLINYPPPSEKEALIQKAMRTWAASTSVSGRSDSGSLYNEEKDF
jgi:cyclase